MESDTIKLGFNQLPDEDLKHSFTEVPWRELLHVDTLGSALSRLGRRFWCVRSGFSKSDIRKAPPTLTEFEAHLLASQIVRMHDSRGPIPTS
jgi:hypothetical protein